MNYFGQWSNLELVRQDGTRRLAADVLRDVPYVLLLFGAAWHPDCNSFFDTIHSFYEKHHLAKGFEVVFISRDYNEADMMRGFLLKEREATAAARQQRRERKEERQRHKQQQQQQQDQEHSADSSEASCRDSASGEQKEPTRGRDAAAETTSPAQLPSSPPPLKRVAELAPVTATHSFSGTLGLTTAANPLGLQTHGSQEGSGGFWAVPYEHVGQVGVPILYHLRVFTYPGVIVCRNKSLHPSIVPELLPSLATASHTSNEPLPEETAVRSDRSNAPRRWQKTPKVARRECYPDVVTITGRFRIEREDPDGEQFPWERMSSDVRFAALVFLTVTVSVLILILSIVLPAVYRVKQLRTKTAAQVRR